MEDLSCQKWPWTRFDVGMREKKWEKNPVDLQPTTDSLIYISPVHSTALSAPNRSESVLPPISTCLLLLVRGSGFDFTSLIGGTTLSCDVTIQYTYTG